MLTSICLVTHVKNEKRMNDLLACLNSLIVTLRAPAEVVIVDDVSPIGREYLEKAFNIFKQGMSEAHPDIKVVVHFNEKNLRHAASQNLSMKLAVGECLIHMEDDIVVQHEGWNQVFAKYLEDHPEVGQVLPLGSGRGEWIERSCGYREFMWGLGGLWAIKREVYDKVGTNVWDPNLIHQLEPDLNFRVRMEGYRVIEVNEFPMIHLGEGDEGDTFERQAQITIGVYNFLKKWNRRFMGFYGYHTVPCMSPDDYPINVFFRRQLSAWYAAESKRLEALVEKFPTDIVLKDKIKDFSRCRLNENPEPFQFPGHWGVYELVKLIRPKGRERENEMIEKMGNNHVWKDEPELHKQVRELSERYAKKNNSVPMTDDEVTEFLKGKEMEYTWTCNAYSCVTPKV